MKLTNPMIELIKLDIQKGLSMSALTKKYNVKKNAINSIKQELGIGQPVGQPVSQPVAQPVAQNVPHAGNNVTSRASNLATEQPKATSNASNIATETQKVISRASSLTKKASTINTYLSDNADILIKIIEDYKKANVIPKGGIVVQLPNEPTGDYKTSIRVNRIVMDKFRLFCEAHKEFTQKELLSQALINFMEQYR